MHRTLTVSLDVGTSGCRAAAIRTDGSIAFVYQTPLVPLRPQEGLSEYQAEDLLNVARKTLHKVLDAVGPQQVAALAITSQRSTIVLWDKTTGNAIGPVLTWEDGRASKQVQEAPISQEEIHLKTGLYKTPFFSAPKIAWCFQNFSQAKELVKQKRLLAAPVASYIIWHLTDGKTFATDYSLAQRTLLFDIQSLTWDPRLCQAFGIPIEILPQVLPSAADYGCCVYQGVSIPIRTCVGDQQACATYFALTASHSLINYGTGAFWLYHTGERPIVLPGMLTSVSADCTIQEPSYMLEGPVNAAGSALLWLRAQGITFNDEELDALCSCAANPVRFLPAFGGLGAPYWDFMVPTAIEHVSTKTRKSDWIAGVVQSVAFLLADIAVYLQENGCNVTGPIWVSGGLSHINYLTAFQANILQQDLHVSLQADATILGAALLAARKQGLCSSFKPQYKLVSPDIDKTNGQALYVEWKKFVTRCRQNH